MITKKNVQNVLDLIDKYMQSTIELCDASKSTTLTETRALDDLGAKNAKDQDALENCLTSMCVPQSRKRTAYVCNGCGGLYWQNGINCDCNIPYMKEYKMTKVTVVSQKPFNEFLKKGKNNGS